MDLQVEEFDSKIRKIIPEEAALEQLATGFAFTEGPVWCGDYLLFSDIPNNRIVRLQNHSYGPEVTTYRTPSGNSNGLTRDRSGRLIACEHSGRRVTRTEVDGSVSVLADNYKGKRLNSPNDVVVRSDGSVYFTDPTYGLGDPPRWMELPSKGVYRIAPDGELILLVDDFNMPNGLAFSPDESILYINDYAEGLIRAFDVNPDGGLNNDRLFIKMDKPEPGSPDGMKVDREGNLYVCGPGGVWILSPQGQVLGMIKGPEIQHNLAWGDQDGRTLYMTAMTGIYRMRSIIPGVRP